MIKKLKLFHFLIIFPLLWMIYYLFELITGNIFGIYHITMNLIPALLLCIVSYVFFWHYKNSIIFKKFTLSVLILTLFLIDQVSKIIVSIVFKSKNLSSINLIKDYFSITPHINDQGSFIASRFDVNLPFIFFIVLNLIILIFVFELYNFRVQSGKINSIEQMTFILIFSGGFCSLIDKIFWRGSLDFLHIHNLFIADIKDIYITLGLGNFILSNIISDEDFKMKNFYNFTLEKFKKWFKTK